MIINDRNNKDMDSPIYEVSNPLIAAAGRWRVHLEQMPYDVYLPFNFVQIQNNSAQRLRLIVNDSIRKIIPAGVIMNFDSSTIPAIWAIEINNLDILNEVPAEDLQLSFQKIKGVTPVSVKLFGGGI